MVKTLKTLLKMIFVADEIFFNTRNYQREDLIRGQMDFGKKQPLNEDGKFWMAVDIASLYGEDKMDKAHQKLQLNGH